MPGYSFKEIPTMAKAEPAIFPDAIEVNVKYGPVYTFTLREISMSEEQQLRSKSFGLSDEKAAMKEYDQNVKILTDLAEKPTTVTELVDGDKQISDLPSDFFASRSPRKERIAFFAVRGYFLRLLPEDSF
jgi:hypothetical protein